MQRSASGMPFKSNAVLAALPAKVLLEIKPHLAPVKLPFGRVLYHSGKPMREVYFPARCLVSLLVVLEDELALEVALVGHEGVLGVPLALGARISPVRALVQGAGDALRMNAAQFLVMMGRHPLLQRAVFGYAGRLMGQIAQTAACNRFHLLEPRLARWLLMTRDRLGCEEFRMTQEFLSTMLGVRRVGVSDAASSFQRQHLIEYSRGHITILDHAGLEAAACSCYARGVVGQPAVVPWRPEIPKVANARKRPPAPVI
jgi:CRP-like cAMP-binding protein